MQKLGFKYPFRMPYITAIINKHAEKYCSSLYLFFPRDNNTLRLELKALIISEASTVCYDRNISHRFVERRVKEFSFNVSTCVLITATTLVSTLPRRLNNTSCEC